MILEKLAVVNGSAGKDIDGRAYIGGCHLICDAVPDRHYGTDEVVFDGLAFEWMKVSNPFVDIQTRSY